jgi:DNA-binding transcriptional MerR regulator
MDKSPEAFRTISEVAEDLGLPQHVLRFWETRFSQIRPLKRGGGRRYYRPLDVHLLKTIQHLLYGQGYTIKGVQRLLKEKGAKEIAVTFGESSGARFPVQPTGSAADEEREAAAEAGGEAPSDQFAPSDDDLTGPARRPQPDSGASEERASAAAPLAAGAITRRDLDRLREALLDLAECERVLAAARAL